MNKRYYLFSNGTECILWQLRNCEQCFKSSHYNEKTNTYTKYRCAIQEHIERAAITDGMGNKRDYEATHQTYCPYAQRSRVRSRKSPKILKEQMMLPFNES